MKTPEYYETDVLAFFEGKPAELAVYRGLFRLLDGAFPEGWVKVQKTQISFYDRHLYAAASLLLRRRKGWPEHCLLVTFGLSHRVESPRIAAAAEPYPNRWTHHVTVAGEEEIDGELMGWLREAHDYAFLKEPLNKAPIKRISNGK